MDNHQNDRILLMDETEPWLLWVQDGERESDYESSEEGILLLVCMVCRAQCYNDEPCFCEPDKLPGDILLEAEARRKNDPDSPYTEEEEEAIANITAIPTDPRLYIPTKTESGHEVNLDDL
jgi:hypothetical protein